MRKLKLLLLIAVLITACNDNSIRYIYTATAFEKYGHLLKNRLFFAFPEVYENPLRWFDSIPETKLEKINNPSEFTLNGRPGEIFIFQIGVWALNSDVSEVQLEFSDLKGKNGRDISASRLSCYNTGGVDFKGNDFKKTVNITRGRVQAFWIGIDLDSISAGSYRGYVNVLSGSEKQAVPILLKVSGDPVLNHGYNEGSRLSRLNWLNSKVGEDEQVTRGYTPIVANGNRISILGRVVEIGETGLPESIQSYFGPSNQSLLEAGEPILSQPMRFIIEKENGTIEKLHPHELVFTEKTPSRISWKLLNTSADFELEVNGTIEFDGFCDYSLKLTSKDKAEIKDIRLEIPVEKSKASYMMGLGCEGGSRPSEWRWKWDVTRNQDMLWVGSVNGGMSIKLKAGNYVRPLISVYYNLRPLEMPPSWGNEGKGGVAINEKNATVLINAYSGKRRMERGETLNYNFELLITPFKVIDRKIKFGDRYFHGGGSNTSVKVDSAKKYGANIINIHHFEDIYSFINYPYEDANLDAMKKLVNQAHQENIRLKVYFLTSEFTKNQPLFWPLNSLNGEIIYPGPGNSCRTIMYPDGLKEWFIKNLREKYIPSWYYEIKEGRFKGQTDLSVITTPDSRLNNFFVGALDWMVQNIGIDGAYIDDTQLDRTTLRRARKVIDKYRPEGRIDLHSWNTFNDQAGFASCLISYMDILPYLDLIWIGEGRDYNKAPDTWLVEVSGIPFGLPGQMLADGGNPWRGMVYGITNRPGWEGYIHTDIWKFWDEYKIEDMIMTGYWEENCPVKIANKYVKASVYKSDSEAIISVANWTDMEQPAVLKVDWMKMGLNPSTTDISIPEITGFQDEQKSVSLDNITIPAKKGFLIVLKRR